MKTKEGMMKVANLSMKMLKEGRLDEYLHFIPALIGGAARAVGAVAGAGRAAGAVAGAARAAGGLGKAAKAVAGGLGKAARVASTVNTMGNIANGISNAYSDPTYKRATGKHLEHTDWRLEMKADDIMNSAIDKVNKK